ncbi:MAG: hypothetical protein ACFFE2_13590 [Candidatus Thorarchaeota archaeon]
MRLKVVIGIIAMLMILSILIPASRADTEIVPKAEEEELTPILFATAALEPWFESYTPHDMCVSNDGTMFAVGFNPMWQLIRGDTPTSLVAWGNDGNVLWSRNSSVFSILLYEVATDDQHVFVVGRYSGDIYLAKYDFLGNNLWNISWDLGNSEYGTRLALLDDGTIVIGGNSFNYSEPYTSQDFLMAFDQDGGFQWIHMFPEPVSFCCLSNSIYSVTNNTLQKWTSNGDLAWSRTCDEGKLVCISEYLIYVLDPPDIIIYGSTSFNVTMWNIQTNERIWSHSYRICDTYHNVYNSSSFDYAVTKNGSLMVLFNVLVLHSIYVLNIDHEGTLTHQVKLLNSTNVAACFDLDETDRIHIAGSSKEYDLFVAVFRLENLPPSHSDGLLSNIQIVAVVTIAVILVDAGIIIALRRRYSS